MRREREKKKKKKTHFFSFFGKKKKNFETFQDVDHSKWSVGGHLGGQVQRTNWQVANVTTPANYFHLLRRQLHRSFRKPLVVMSPKNLLRHPAAKSDLDEFDDEASDANIQGVRFKRLIMDEGASDRSANPPQHPEVKRLLLCTGKVYYELTAEREKAGRVKDFAIVRVEQLAPFPFDLVCRELRRYPNAEVMWAQEVRRVFVFFCFFWRRERGSEREKNAKERNSPFSFSLCPSPLSLPLSLSPSNQSPNKKIFSKSQKTTTGADEPRRLLARGPQAQDLHAVGEPRSAAPGRVRRARPLGCDGDGLRGGARQGAGAAARGRGQPGRVDLEF